MHPSYTIHFAHSDLPEMNAAADEYEQRGGSLTRENVFGVDLLHGREDLIALRDKHFHSDVGSFEQIFTNVISNDGHLFEQALITFFSLTHRLSQLIYLNVLWLFSLLCYINYVNYTCINGISLNK